ncbi:MAG: HAMP domain-containing sensor histidine kinase [Melioribacteraceae bacterium]
MSDIIQDNKLLLLGRLTAGLVHEIRNPLSAIKLNLDYMKMAQDDLPSDIKEIVSESLDAFEQVNFLIEDVLDFTRKPTEKTHQVSIQNVTDKCLKIISTTARNKGVSISSEIQENLPLLNANKNKLMQIFMNIINNAIDASEEKGNIFIRSCLENKNGSAFLLWEVQDFGIGMKQEDKEKILGGFFTTKSKGHGIGLGVCKTLIQELKGEMFFDSEYGKGTTFSVKFNLEDKQL